MSTDITKFGELPSGGHARSFRVRGCAVTIRPDDGDADAERLAFALEVAAHGMDRRWSRQDQQLVDAVDRAQKAEASARAAWAAVSPANPDRTIGVGCVRFSDTGQLWLLNHRETGWSSFGVRCDGWDDLFRRYAVRITGHGTDEHGAWWTAEPCADSINARAKAVR